MYDSPELTPSYTKNYANDSWQQPLLLAFLASVGIHAILGINLPNIPLFSKPVKLPPTVGLVELTTEQIARLPKPKTEGEISFENIQLPSNISQIPQQQPSFPRLPPTSTTPSVSNLPRTSVGRSSYEYEIPERPPTRSPVPLRLGRNFPSSVGSLPPNETPRDDFYTYIPPRPTPVSPSPLPIYRRPLPDTYPPSLPPLPNLPEENQGPTEAEIRANIQFDNNEVDESGLFTGNSTRSFLEGVPRPQERYQDKIASRGTNSQQTRPRVETPATTIQPPAEPDPTKINRLPESPLARQIREGKTLREVLNEEANQPERVAVVIPENPTPEVEPRENPPIAPKVEERPAIAVEEQGDFKDLFLADLERSRQQRGQTTLTPEPVATPKPEPVTPTPTVAALPTVEPTPVPEAATEVEASPVPETAIEVEPTPEPKEESKGTLLESFQRDRQLRSQPENSTPPNQIAAANAEEAINIEVPVVEFEEKTPATEPSGEFEDAFQAELEKYRRQRRLMDAAGEGVFSSAEISAAEGGEAYIEWAQALDLEEGNLTNPTNIADVYPDAACSENLTGRALVGVLVSADGEIVEGPELLLGSGHDVLDEAALNAVSDRAFEASDKSKAYQYAFNFNNSGCVGE